MDPETVKQARTNYSIAKHSLKKEILRSKKRNWLELCDELESDVWGKAYQLVMRKFIGRRNAPVTDNIIEKQITTLFPKAQSNSWDIPKKIPDDVIWFTEEEVRSAASKLKNKKAPGPDYKPMEVIKIAAIQDPQRITEILNKCLIDSFQIRAKLPNLF